jgi:hypothetical protein
LLHWIQICLSPCGLQGGHHDSKACPLLSFTCHYFSMDINCKIRSMHICIDKDMCDSVSSCSSAMIYAG